MQPTQLIPLGSFSSLARISWAPVAPITTPRDLESEDLNISSGLTTHKLYDFSPNHSTYLSHIFLSVKWGR